MHSLTLYGTSEDKIKIEGEFREEVDAYDMEEGAYLAINDGTLLAFAADENGVWRIDPLTVGIGTLFEKVDGTLDPESDSDRVTLSNPERPFQWALMGSSLVSPFEWPKTGSK